MVVHSRVDGMEIWDTLPWHLHSSSPCREIIAPCRGVAPSIHPRQGLCSLSCWNLLEYGSTTRLAVPCQKYIELDLSSTIVLGLSINLYNLFHRPYGKEMFNSDSNKYLIPIIRTYRSNYEGHGIQSKELTRDPNRVGNRWTKFSNSYPSILFLVWSTTSKHRYTHPISIIPWAAIRSRNRPILINFILSKVVGLFPFFFPRKMKFDNYPNRIGCTCR